MMNRVVDGSARDTDKDEATSQSQEHRRASARRYPIGAEQLDGGGVHFRVAAPEHRKVVAVLEAGPGAPDEVELSVDDDGYFAGIARAAASGTRYRFRLGGTDGELLPDPASRYQPDGPEGPSEVIDPSAFRWTDRAWRGVQAREGHVLYELHIGTFTPEGSWAAAEEQLPYLAGLGITALEVMPLAEFLGEFGWGYDGVNLFAPYHGYGTPDDVRRFVDRAHALGLAVILDVVYNHFGPDSRLLKPYSEHYFTDKHAIEWGEAVNFDGPGCGLVREFVLTNVAYWMEEFHFDGMRVNATQAYFDTSPEHILKAIARRIRESVRDRGVLVVGENEPQSARLLRGEDRGGFGFDMLWSDDFHHAARVAATGSREGYYGDYLGSPQELVSATRRGWLYQGQWNLREKKRRGSLAFDIAPSAFVHFLQNHDQIGNSARGERLHALTSPGRYRALTALQLLGPATPMLFQGQEFAASGPFLYFADQPPDVAEATNRGRKKFLEQFPSLATAEMQARLPHSGSPETFRRSKLDLNERHTGTHAEALALHTDLLRLRRDDPTIRAGHRLGAVDGAVLGPEAFVVRWFDPEGRGEDRLLVLNLGVNLHLPVATEPLLAPPEGQHWRISWSSEDPRYGGHGTAEPESEALNWRLAAHAAVLLSPVPVDSDEVRNPTGSV